MSTKSLCIICVICSIVIGICGVFIHLLIQELKPVTFAIEKKIIETKPQIFYIGLENNKKEIIRNQWNSIDTCCVVYTQEYAVRTQGVYGDVEPYLSPNRLRIDTICNLCDRLYWHIGRWRVYEIDSVQLF